MNNLKSRFYLLSLILINISFNTVISQESGYKDHLYLIHLTKDQNYSKVIIDSSQFHFICKLAKDDSEAGMFYHYGNLGYWNSKIDTFRLDDDRGIVFINPYPDVVLKLTDEKSNNNLQYNIGLNGFLERYAVGLAEKCVANTSEGTIKLYFDENGFINQMQVIRNSIVQREVFY